MADAPASPWLAQLRLPAPPGDGASAWRGRLGGQRALVLALDPDHLGGSLGEAGAALWTAALEQLAEEARAKAEASPPILILGVDGGGVRLQEGNAALAAAARVHRALARLQGRVRRMALVGRERGCYGALALAAGLCDARVAVEGSALGLSGPRVIETLAPGEVAAAVRAAQAVAARHAAGLVDAVVPAEPQALRRALIAAATSGRSSAPAGTRPASLPDAAPAAAAQRQKTPAYALPPGAGASARAIHALAGRPPGSLVLPDGTLLHAHTTLAGRPARVLGLAWGPHWADAPMACAQARALAAELHACAGTVAAVVAVVACPGQAMSAAQEQLGLHQALADAIAAAAAAERAGTPVLSLTVGPAVSGAFLAHGLCASIRLGLQGPGVEVRAMAPAAMQQVVRHGTLQPHDVHTAAPWRVDAHSFAELGGFTGVCADVHAARAALEAALASGEARAATGGRAWAQPGDARPATPWARAQAFMATSWRAPWP